MSVIRAWKTSVLITLTALSITSRCGTKGQEKAAHTISQGPQGSQSCEANTNECFFDQLDAWFGQLKNKTSVANAKGSTKDTTEDLGNESGLPAPVFQVVKCGDDTSVWKYKYTGAKGKKRIFQGKGKLTFCKSSTPPHGFDYGMKSGHCLMLQDKTIKSIDGTFSDQGILHGEAVIDYFNGTQVQANFVRGRHHGVVKLFVDEIDEETNLPKPHKHLASISVWSMGKEDLEAGLWEFHLDKTMLFRQTKSSKEVLVVVANDFELATDPKEKPIYDDPSEEEEDEAEDKLDKGKAADEPKEQRPKYDFMVGTLDDEEMLLNAKNGIVRKLREPTPGFLYIDYERDNADGVDIFDYDFQIRARVSATVAKLIRFFESAAVWSKELKDSYAVLDAPIDMTVATEIFSEVKALKDNHQDLYEAVCPLDLKRFCRFQFTGDLNDKGEFTNAGTLNMFSNYKVKDLLRPTPKNINEKATDNHGESKKADNGTFSTEAEDSTFNSENYLQLDMIPHYEDNQRISNIRGNFTQGKLNGYVTITFLDGTKLEGFAKDNCLHGISRRLDFPQHKDSQKRYRSRVKAKEEGINYSGKSKITEVAIHFLSAQFHIKKPALLTMCIFNRSCM